VRNSVLVPHISSKIICPFDALSSNAQAPFNWAIHTVTEVHCAVVSVEGLPCLEGSSPRAIRGLTGKSARCASMRATVGIMGAC